MLVSFVRARIEFFLLLAGAAAALAFIYYGGVMPLWLLLVIGIAQAWIVIESTVLAIAKKWEWLGFCLVVMHIAIFCAYFERLLYYGFTWSK